MNCKCKICLRHAEFSKHIARLNEAGLQEEIDFFEDIYSSLNNVELDYQVDEAIIKGQWPSAEEILGQYGWTKQA